jgi:hypothetical protein
MKKLLVNAVGILLLGICVSSCSKKDDDVTPLTKEEIANESVWTISGSPEFNVVFSVSGYDEEAKKVSDTLKYLFKTGDKYLFDADWSCKVTRGASTAPYPKVYTIDGNYLIFDGYIKFRTNVSANKLTLTAGTDEIRLIVRKELLKTGEYKESLIDNTLLKVVTGNARLVFNKEE